MEEFVVCGHGFQFAAVLDGFFESGGLSDFGHLDGLVLLSWDVVFERRDVEVLDGRLWGVWDVGSCSEVSWWGAELVVCLIVEVGPS